MEEARTAVLDLLWQPWDEGPGATEDSGGHRWVGSGLRGPHMRSRMFHSGPPLASCLLFLLHIPNSNLNCSVEHPIKYYVSFPASSGPHLPPAEPRDVPEPRFVPVARMPGWRASDICE